MSGPVTITVYGQPAPQGSKRAFAVRGKGGVPTGRVAVIESSHDRVKSWRQAVIDAALGTPGMPLHGPLSVAVTFTLSRPKAHYRTGRSARMLRDSAPAYPAGTPDLDKLLRSTMDGLTAAGLWLDDAQVVEYERLTKRYAGNGGMSVPGATITVRRLDGQGAAPKGFANSQPQLEACGREG